MQNYEDDKARYWRNCDLWTFNEVQFLLNGQWPEDKSPPSSLNLILLETEVDVDHPLEDGSVITITETEEKVINPLPSTHGLRGVIEDAIASGALTVIKTGNVAESTNIYKRDLESRFKPAQVIAWAASRGCFPDFPFGQEEQPANMEAREDADHKEAAAWFEYWIERDQREAAEKRIKEPEAQLMPPVLFNADIQGNSRSRNDLLTPIIESAKRRCDASPNAAAIFSVLRQWAIEKPPKPPLFSAMEDGIIKWLDDQGRVRELTLKKLRDRLRTRHKTA